MNRFAHAYQVKGGVRFDPHDPAHQVTQVDHGRHLTGKVLRELDGDGRLEVGDRELELGPGRRRDTRLARLPAVDDQGQIVVTPPPFAPCVDGRNDVLARALERLPELCSIGAMHASPRRVPALGTSRRRQPDLTVLHDVNDEHVFET